MSSDREFFTKSSLSWVIVEIAVRSKEAQAF
jgi:hypothetical protein